MTGMTVGALKCRCSTLSRRSTSTAMLVMVNTISSRKDVVPPSALRSANQTRPKASTVVNRMATHGVRRLGRIRPRVTGSTPSCAMP